MRNLLYLILATGLLICSACGNSDDEGDMDQFGNLELTAANLAGDWRLASFRSVGTIQLQGETVETASSFGGQMILTFNSNGEWTSSGPATLAITRQGTTTSTTKNTIGGGAFAIDNNRLFLSGLDPQDGTQVSIAPGFSINNFQQNFLTAESAVIEGGTDVTYSISLERQ